MRPTVYVETSVFGYLAMRPSAQLVTAANQQVTREFWEVAPVICTPFELIEVPNE